MPVVDAIKRWSRRSWEISRDGRTATDVWQAQVVEDEGIDPRQALYDAGLLPRKGDASEDFEGMYCVGVALDPGDGPTTWEATIRWSTPNLNEPPTDPTIAPPVVVIGGEALDEQIDTDLDLEPIANTAGEPFDPPIVSRRTDLVIDYQVNVLLDQVNIAWLLSFRDKTNSEDMPGIGDAGEVLVDGAPTAELVHETEDLPAYWKIRIVLKIRENSEEAGAPAKNAWKRRILSQGYRQIVDSDLKTVVDQDGMPLNQPVLLDANGVKTDTPYWLWFRVYDEADLNDLNIQIPGITP